MVGILGIDHICASCDDIAMAVTELNRLDFQRLFEERELPVPREKRRFLRQSTNSHSAVFLRSTGGVSVELIDHHGELNEYQAPYQVFFGTPENPSADTEAGDTGLVGRALGEALGYEIVKHTIPELGLSCFQPQTETDMAPGISLVALECGNLAFSSTFWRDGLGFHTAAVSEGKTIPWCLLEFLALMPAWSLKVLLVETGETSTGQAFIDDSGWTCVSFVVTDIESTLQHLTLWGGTDIGRPYSMSVGGKDMQLCFLRGPGLELIELVGPTNRGGRV